MPDAAADQRIVVNDQQWQAVYREQADFRDPREEAGLRPNFGTARNGPVMKVLQA